MYSLSDVAYPICGVNNIISNLSEIANLKASNKKQIFVYSSAQPNSNPHLGTITTMMSAFAIAEHLKDSFNLKTTLKFLECDNSFGEKKSVDNKLYYKSLSYCEKEGEKLSDLYMKSFKEIFEDLSNKTGVNHEIYDYTNFQFNPHVRKALLKIINRKDEFRSILAPRDKRIRLRFACPKCRLVNKSADDTKYLEVNEERAKISSRCPEHGEFVNTITDKNDSDIFDCNTPLLAALNGVWIMESSKEKDALSVMVDGSDWGGVWLNYIFINSINRLGYDYKDWPVRFFTPTITDWSGAKLSKSLHVAKGTYSYLPEGLLDFKKFLKQYGKKGYEIIWNEVQEWIKDPKKFLRNYSVNYFNLLLKQATY